ncbi:hypothetical protein SAV14893_098500 [Streptomyces avermitilis]|uniref:Uncharacterized protein n=1 Tax=Streptomyces avermitilis TaxID=33903 RepID=A0A4D4N8H3_STRAX|nr:hypothetical protein SAV14893_098500 [Streptomyces avermitilis]GDY80773.1 hypothetical protein SAV31267_102580 [Streptomyces avermitilis]
MVLYQGSGSGFIAEGCRTPQAPQQSAALERGGLPNRSAAGISWIPQVIIIRGWVWQAGI